MPRARDTGRAPGDAAAELLDDVGLRRAADGDTRDAGVHAGRCRVEQIVSRKNLAVGDRDHVGRHEPVTSPPGAR